MAEFKEAPKIALGEIVKEIRNQENLSQEELASKSGLHRTYIADIESGNRNVSIVGLLQIASALGRSVSEMLDPLEEKIDRISSGENA